MFVGCGRGEDRHDFRREDRGTETCGGTDARGKKELRKELLASKLDKKQVEVQMKELKDALELGGNLRQGYVDSQEHMAVARRGLINMMEDMNEIPIDDVKRDLDRLNGHLDQIFHECGIREDDPDFKSTADGLKNMAANMDKINLIIFAGASWKICRHCWRIHRNGGRQIFLHSHIIYSMRRRAKSERWKMNSATVF